MMLDYLLAGLVLLGGAFTLVGSVGLVKMPDFYMRLHGPTKATTLGVGALLIASALYFSIRGETLSLHEILVTLFLFITAPVSAHLMAKAAIHLRSPHVPSLHQPLYPSVDSKAAAERIKAAKD
jgi:multicomponent K+:H+ antiporter subunit G